MTARGLGIVGQDPEGFGRMKGLATMKRRESRRTAREGPEGIGGRPGSCTVYLHGSVRPTLALALPECGTRNRSIAYRDGNAPLRVGPAARIEQGLGKHLRH